MNKLITISTALLTVAAVKAQTPNIVFILADDLGYGDISAFNPESKIHTPNIDKLAEHGIAFTDAHASSALSTPSRYSLLTGRYPWRTKLKRGGLDGDSPAMIDPERRTIAQMFSANGYNTACIGKWHLGWDWGFSILLAACALSFLFIAFTYKEEQYLIKQEKKAVKIE